MGTAKIQGQILGTRARDWAEIQESVAIPLLEALAIKAGMTPGNVETVECPWDYPDEKTALRGLLSSGR